MRTHEQAGEATETCAGLELNQCAEVFDELVKTLRTAFNRMVEHDREELQKSLDWVRHSALRMSEGRLRWKMSESGRKMRGDALMKWIAGLRFERGPMRSRT